MRLFLVLFFITGFIFSSSAQRLTAENYQQLKLIEPVLKNHSDSIINASSWFQRFNSDADLTKSLVMALKTPYSFYYPFDSVYISTVYAPDSSFRIFTWQIMKDLSYYRQRGAIQMNTKDGSLKLYPLFDVSDFTENPNDSVRDASRWIGAVYYKIILKKYNEKNYYTLLGTDENNERTNKKWMDILTFDAAGKPQFGRNCFVYPNDITKPKQPCYRFNLEFRKNGGARIRYDEKLDVVIFDRLYSEGNDPQTKSTLIPYGEFEGFRWINGKWVFTANPFEALDFEEKINIYPKPLLDKIPKNN
jgi:hypothetical protein